jgi:hypothetical protein
MPSTDSDLRLKMDGIHRIVWTACSGFGGRHAPDSMATFGRITRIAQQTLNGWQYFLPDALGSARQLTDAAGALALAQSFDPYGLLSSQGSAATSYGYAGEWGYSGLLYLRARYYALNLNQFFQTAPILLHPGTG